jgi:hypothetical protein
MIAHTAEAKAQPAPPPAGFLLRFYRVQANGTLDLSMDRKCIVDSPPTPVVQFHLVPGSTGDWRAFEATFGKIPTKNRLFSAIVCTFLSSWAVSSSILN